MNKIKKSGGIAIPFLLTFLISLIIIGGAALIIYDKLSEDDVTLEEMTTTSVSVSDEDSHTVMLILDLSDTVDSANQEDTDDEDDWNDEDDEDDWDDEDDDDDWDDEDDDWDDEDDDEDDWDDEDEDSQVTPEPYTFMIMRSVPVNRQITFIGLPSNTVSGEKTYSEIYQKSGAADLCPAVSGSLEIDVDKYMVLDSEAFQKLCNVLGGVNFVVPGDISGFSKDSGEQYLGPQQIENLISYGGFTGEIQRVSTAASLMTDMLNQASGTRIADNLDNTFEQLINMTDSNISALDYENKKAAVKYLLKYTEPSDEDSVSSRARFITPYGRQTRDTFEIDDDFISDIEPYFADTAEADQQEATENPSGLKTMVPNTEAESSNE
jgi:hypothetical protein